MTVHAYLFELRQIQGYVFATNKLRDASGASELINAICNLDDKGLPSGLAGRLIAKILPGAKVHRAAGGCLELTWDGPMAALATFRAAFRLGVCQMAPGLIFGDSIGAGDDIATARADARSRASDDGPIRGLSGPMAAPMIRPAPLSGGVPAVVSGWTTGGTCTITKAYADLPTLAKRQYLKKGTQDLADQFAGVPDLIWPNVFDKTDDNVFDKTDDTAGQAVFPFAGAEIKRIALIHADGNGIGAMFEKAVTLLDPDRVADLSQALADATRKAVQQAMAPVVAKAQNGIVPARPILLGGDDITLIVRADLAMEFAKAFVLAFQDLATKAVHKFPELKKWPMLTVKVGIVILGPRQPFGQAYQLCEVLAGLAKVDDESRISFWRLVTSRIPQTKAELFAEAAGDGGTTVWRASHTLAELQALQDIARLMADDDVGRGGLRRVPELLKTSRVEAERTFQRSLEVLKGRNPDLYTKLTTALGAFNQGHGAIPIGSYSPLLQAHDIGQITR